MRSYAKILYVFFYIKLLGMVTCWPYMASLLTSPAPLLHLSCTLPAPLLIPAAPLCAAPFQQKLEGYLKDTSNHVKTNAKLRKKLLYKADRCD